MEYQFRAFPLLLGIPEERCRGVFIAENARRCTSPALHLQEKCFGPRSVRGFCFARCCGQSGTGDATAGHTNGKLLSAAWRLLQSRLDREAAGRTRAGAQSIGRPVELTAVSKL